MGCYADAPLSKGLFDIRAKFPGYCDYQCKNCDKDMKATDRVWSVLCKGAGENHYWLTCSYKCALELRKKEIQRIKEELKSVEEWPIYEEGLPFDTWAITDFP